MTILTNKDKAIQYSVSNEIVDYPNNGPYKFSVTLPTINCSDKKDAELIQNKVNELVQKLAKDLLDL